MAPVLLITNTVAQNYVKAFFVCKLCLNIKYLSILILAYYVILSLKALGKAEKELQDKLTPLR